MVTRIPVQTLRNIGSETAQDLKAVGVLYLDQLEELGAEQAFIRLMEGRKQCGKQMSCYNALYLYALYGALNDLDWRAIPTHKKQEFKEFTKKIRQKNSL